MKIDDAAARLEALGNPTRLRIYRTLVRAGDAGSSVGKLQTKLDLAASTLSHHLKAMMMVGLVEQQRQGTTLICRANYEVMRGIVDFTCVPLIVPLRTRTTLPAVLVKTMISRRPPSNTLSLVSSVPVVPSARPALPDPTRLAGGHAEGPVRAIC